MGAPNLPRTKEVRRQLYKKYRLSGLTLRESAELAGYAKTTAKCMAKYKIEKDIKASMAQQLDKAGLTDQKLAESLADVVENASKTITCDKELHTVPDQYLKLKAIDLASTLKGHKTEQNLNVSNTQVNIQVKFPDETDEVTIAQD